MCMYTFLSCHKFTYQVRVKRRFSRFHFVVRCLFLPVSTIFWLCIVCMVWHIAAGIQTHHTHIWYVIFIFLSTCSSFFRSLLYNDSISMAPAGICHLTIVYLPHICWSACGLCAINKNPLAGNVHGPVHGAPLSAEYSNSKYLPYHICMYSWLNS